MYKSIILTFSVFLIIFAPVLNIGIGYFGDTLIFFCLIHICWFLWKGHFYKIIVFNEVKVLCVLLLSLMMYAMLNSLFISNEIGVLQGALRPVRALITLLGVYAFLRIYVSYYREQFVERLISDVYFAIGVHAFIMVAQFIWPDFRSSIYAYTFADQVLEYNQEFRMAGLTNGGGAQLSVFQSLGAVLFPFLTTKKKLSQVLLNVVILALIFLSIIVTGRSGIFVILFFMPIAFYWSSKYVLKKSLFSKSSLTYLVLIVLVIVMLLEKSADMMTEIVGEEKAAYYEVAMERGFEIFMNYGESGTIEDRTVSILYQEHLFLPDSVLVLLLGDVSVHELDRRGVDSDIGYVRFIFGYGLTGSILQYSFYFVSLLYAYKLRKTSHLLFFINVLLLAIILAFHTKEIFVLTKIGFSVTSLFTIAMFYSQRMVRNNSTLAESSV